MVFLLLAYFFLPVSPVFITPCPVFFKNDQKTCLNKDIYRNIKM